MKINKKIILIFSLAFLILASVVLLIFMPYEKVIDKTEKKNIPSDWFYTQRAYPNDHIPYEKYFEAVERKNLEETRDNSGLIWNPSGPSNVGGRITAIAVDPANTNIIIAGAAAGGIFKTTNGGLNWAPKTDHFPSLSIGAIEMNPFNPNIIYCGTGESNSAIDNYPGFGIIKSTDKGDSWNFLGLQQALHIGAISISPQNTDLMFAAVLTYRSASEDKGIYKSNDGGVNWTRVLFVSDSTGGIDVKIDPSDSNIVYASMWERVRFPPNFSKTGGISSSLYRSADAGNTWTRLQSTYGLPNSTSTTGRINIAIAPSNPNTVYAVYKNSSNNNIAGVYKSTNKGLNWSAMTMSGLSSGGFSWYFGLIKVDPVDPNKVYVGDIDLFRSTNGGSWFNLTESYSGSFDQQHPDQHVLWINPSNTNFLINGNDGGIFRSTNGGGENNWTKLYDLPVSQFYAGSIDYLMPQRKYGGTQDNGTMRTLTGSTDDWDFIYGGDGFHTFVDYTNSNIIYAESQYGGIGRSTDGGLNFNYIAGGLTGRFNWSTPYILDIANPAILYLGTHMLFRTTNRGNSWTAISPDLTHGPNGRLGTLTAVSSAVLPDSQRVIITGADDSKVSISTNSGTSWNDISGSLPNRYVTDVLIDKRNPSIAYVTLSGFNQDLRNPHVFRTVNYGTDWTDISGNLPDIPVNSVIIDYNRDSVLYAGTDAGVYYTRNLGESWQLLGAGLPNSPVFDLAFHPPTQKLVAITHGRSMFEIDVTNLPLSVNQISTAAEAFKLYQNYPNPFNPGTVISYSLKENGYVTLKIFDILGKEVATLVNAKQNAGTYNVEWDAGKYNSGVYFYKLSTEKFSDTKRMILLK
jgi:photosystem II stability/assembly factor-like uncharacterized protein